MAGPISLYFDVWPAATPNSGAALGELTQARAKKIQKVLSDTGLGQFTINRHDSQAAWVETGNLVRVRTVGGGPFAWDSANYKFAFYIEDKTDEIVSPDEQGGDDWTRGGRGILSVLEHLVWWNATFLVGSDGPRADGKWHWYQDQFADIFLRSLLEWNARPASKPIPATLTYDFTSSLDSDGVAWAAFDGDHAIDNNTDYLRSALDLASQGFEVGMTPAYLVQAWIPGGKGTDKSATVAFRQGWNIRQAGSRVGHGPRRATRALVEGSGSSFLEVTDALTAGDEAGKWGRREVGVKYGTSTDPAPLIRAGQQALAALRFSEDGPPQFGVTSYGLGSDGGTPSAKQDFLPFVDYDEGDTITLDVPGEYANVAKRIHAITIEEAENGEAEVTLTLDSSPFDAASSSAAGASPAAGVGGVGAHSHPPNPPLCDLAHNLLRGLAEANLKAYSENPSYGKENAVDGDDSTHWSGEEPPAGDPVANAWWAADLGVSEEVEAYRILQDNPGDAPQNIATEIRIYGSDSGAAWGWLPVGHLSADPAANGWTLVATRTNPLTSPQESGPRMLGSAQTFRYWLFRAVTGGTLEWDVNEFELLNNFLTGTGTQAARCDHNHRAEWLKTRETDTDLVLRPDGTGGVEFAAEAGLPWFVVTDYGALGDGATDDITAINAAIAALNAAGRGVLYFPAGTYLISGALTTITVPALVKGDGMATFNGTTAVSSISTTSNNSAMFTVSGHPVKFEDLALVGGSVATPTTGSIGIKLATAIAEAHFILDSVSIRRFHIGIDVQTSAYSVIDKCVVVESVKYDLKIQNTVDDDHGDMSISNSSFLSRTYTPDAHIRIESSGGIKITNCKLNWADHSDTLAVYGIDLAIGSGVVTGILLISNTSIENVSGDAIHGTTVAGTSLWGGINLSNVQVGLWTNNIGYALNLVGAEAGDFTDISVTGCRFHTDGTPRTAIQLTNVAKAHIGPVVLDGFDQVLETTTSTDVRDATGSIGNEVAISGVPSLGQVPVASGANAAAWEALSTTTDGMICVDPGVPTVDSGTPFGVTIVTKWGVNAGAPYYDTVAADAGDEAALFWDPITTHYFLIEYDF